jgi:hypothetical protein
MKAFKVRRNGQDYFRVDLPKDASRSGKRQSVMAATRREAIQKAQQIIDRRKRVLSIDEGNAPLTDFL